MLQSRFKAGDENGSLASSKTPFPLPTPHSPLRQRPLQIVQQVGDVLDAHREAQQLRRDAQPPPIRFRQGAVAGAPGVREGAHHVGQAGGQRNAPGQPLHERLGVLDFQAQHAPEAVRVQLLGTLELRVALQAGMVDPPDVRVVLEHVGDGLGVAAVRPHPQAQGLQALKRHPGIEGADGAAQPQQHAPRRRHQVRSPRHHAPEGGAVAAQVLGQRVGDEVGPVCSGPEDGGRGEGVVHAQQRAALMGDGRQPGHVGHRQQRIGQGLGVQQFGIGTEGGGHRAVVEGVHEAHLYAQPGQFVAQQGVGDPVDPLVGDEMVARRQHPQKRGADGRHAARRAGRRFGPLQLGDGPLQGAAAWGRVAVVEVRPLLPGHARLQAVQIGKAVHGGLVDRLDQRRADKGRGVLAGAGGQGGEGRWARFGHAGRIERGSGQRRKQSAISNR